MRVDRTVKEILEQNVDCILCMDDAVTSRVLKVLREQHVRVPQDVRVASFMTARFSRTMCRQSLRLLSMPRNLEKWRAGRS